MLKVSEILEVNLFNITCRFNNGVVKELNIKPILENHKHLKGIDKLYDESIFKKVKIGILGEIMWENIISTNYKNKTMFWNYDISPEFAYNS